MVETARISTLDPWGQVRAEVLSWDPRTAVLAENLYHPDQPQKFWVGNKKFMF